MRCITTVVRNGKEGVFLARSSDKDTDSSVVRAALALMDAVRVLHIDQIWIAEAESAREVERLREFAESNNLKGYSGSREAVTYMAEDEAKGFLMGWREIIREDDKPPRLGPMQFQRQDGV